MIVLGLGSNHGDRPRYLTQAVEHLRSLLKELRCSRVYESPALMPPGAPRGWDVPFLNMAVIGGASLGPQALLAAVKEIERTVGRVARGHWGPREIDIDILAYDDQVIAETGLVIPHKELLKRDFALVPLAQLAPEWVHPDAKKTARELAEQMNSNLIPTGITIP